MKFLFALITASLAFLTSCGTLPEKPKKVGPLSEHSQMPWNVPQAGEGEGFLGGGFGQNR